jgi:CHAD domain-containing protein
VTYQFERPVRLAFEIRRVATERLDDALDQLAGGLAQSPAEAVHAARKDLKKTRSLLRLVKDSIGAERFRIENDRLREAAHALASIREADALAESLTALIEQQGPSLTPEVRAAGSAWLGEMTRKQEPGAAVLFAASEASVLIAGARDDARTWALGYGSFGLIESGLRRTYRQGRRYLEASVEDPTDEILHEWRKRVKDMWYSLRLMGKAWEPVLGPLADQAHDLSDMLGDHHDLGELRTAIELNEAQLSVPAREGLRTAACARQAELHESAASLGRRLYAEGPRRYVERLESYWRAWEDDASRQVGQDGLPSS